MIGSGRRRCGLAIAVAAFLLVLSYPGGALGAGFIEGVHPDAIADYDTRTGSIDPTAAQLQAVEALGARATWNDFGTPHTLVAEDAFLATGVQGNDAVAAARNWLDANRALFRLASVDGLVLHGDAKLASSQGHSVTFRQKFGTLDAWPDGLVTIGLTGSPATGWSIASASSTLTGATALTGSGVLSLQAAWQRAAADVGRNVSLVSVGPQLRIQGGFATFGVGNFLEPQYARPIAFVTPTGVVPAVEALVLGGVHNESRSHNTGWRLIVDAANGDVLMRSNLVSQLEQASDPQTFTGSTTTVEAACGPDHTFSVGANVASIDIGAFAEQPLNDIVLVLKKGTVELQRVNNRGALVLRPGPETIHYAPTGGVPAGADYAVQVCDDPSPPAAQAPATYQATVVVNDVVPMPDPQGFPPTWKVFPANPLPHTQVADPWNNPSTDIRKTWCWAATIPGCDEAVENAASPFPWDVDTRTQTPTFTTEGNNASTTEAWTDPLAPGALAQKPVSASRKYSFPWTNAWFTSDCSQNQLVPGGNDISASVANLFAMHNRMHDWSYHLGFTERAWNMQANNFGDPAPPPPGTPGAGGQGDPVLGQSQAGATVGGWPDYLGRDNANMRSLPDGVSPITNMYLWQPLAGAFYAPCVDGDYDMGIIGHEYGHAIENRMIGKGGNRGGPTSDSGATGESYGDLNGMEILNEYGYVPVAGENQYSIGSYATGNKQTAIRNFGMNFPNTGAFPTPGVKPLINPLNYAAKGYDITGPQVHADGEIWSKVNFAIRQALVTKYNATFPASNAALQKRCANGLVASDLCPGNRRWAQLMYDAMLLMPTNPSMLEQRDAYLAADLMRAGDPSISWPSNQNELWLEFARHGFGANAFGTNDLVGNGDLNPKPSYESPRHSLATIRFNANAKQGGTAPKARIYVGHFEARVSAVADTDPGTSMNPADNLPPCNTSPAPAGCGGENTLDNVARFVAGTYEFTAHAPGYGHLYFRVTVGAGQTKTVTLSFPTNFASPAKGAVVMSSQGTNAAVNLIDETENTQWERVQPHDPLTGAQPDVQGSQATIRLGATGVVKVNRVQVSALLGPGQNRFTALRAFRIFTCVIGGAVNPTCDGTLPPIGGVTPGFTEAYASPANAFPTGPPRPTAADMLMRSFSFPARQATHVQLRVETNQCTGNPQFQGDQDNDVTGELPQGHQTDCRFGAFPYGAGADVPAVGAVGLGRAPQRGSVRVAELQVFTTTGGV